MRLKAAARAKKEEREKEAAKAATALAARSECDQFGVRDAFCAPPGQAPQEREGKYEEERGAC